MNLWYTQVNTGVRQISYYAREYKMSTNSKKYVCKAVTGFGWRIWNRKQGRFWGNYFKEYPQQLLDELNGPKRPEEITKLSKGK